MRAKEFLNEKGFLGSLGKGLARGISSFGKEYSKLAGLDGDTSRAEKKKALEKGIQRAAAELYKNIIQISENVRANINPNSEKAKNILRNQIREQLSNFFNDVVKVDASDPKIAPLYDQLKDLSIGAAEQILKGKDELPEVKEFIQIIGKIAKILPKTTKSQTITGQPFQARALHLSDNDEETLYLRRKNGDWIAFSRPLGTDKAFTKHFLSKEQQKEIENLADMKPGLYRPQEFIKLGPNKIDFDVGQI